MDHACLDTWLWQSQRRQSVLLRVFQPATPRQLAQWTQMSLSCCMGVLAQLAPRRLVRCLNPHARRSRLYWLTGRGRACQRRLCQRRGLPPVQHHLLAGVDWELYGWVCYSHRAAVIRALNEPLRPATIKRRARQRQPELRMSANNVRDVVRLLLARGVVCRVQERPDDPPRYELSPQGQLLRQLLLRAVVGP